MASYPWPGNVRELRNTLERAVIFRRAETIEPEDLGLPKRGRFAPMTVRWSKSAEPEIDIPDEGFQFEDIERAMIVAGLRKAGGSQSEAARLLGMTRDTLRYRMEKFGLGSNS